MSEAVRLRLCPSLSVNIFNAPLLQTQSLSQSLPRDVCHSSSDSSSAASASSTQSNLLQYAMILAERLKDARKRIQELEDTTAEWRTQCHAMCGVISHLQNQLQAKENRRDIPTERTRVEAWILAQAEIRKAAEDQFEARRKRRADGSSVFIGPLNKSRRKEDLKDLAAALNLLEVGKKNHLLDRIFKHFNEHPDLKTSPRFEGLFNPRPRKRIRLADIPMTNP